MSLDAFNTFLSSNPEALAKVKACSNHAEVAAIAKANGIDVTPAELMKSAAQATAELDDDALEAVAGGAWGDSKGQDTDNTVAVGVGVVGAGGAIAAASIAAGIAIK